MIKFTKKAVEKALEILNKQEPKPEGLRVAVIGGGCSGFSYQLGFASKAGAVDKVFEYSKESDEPLETGKKGDLTVFVDMASLAYLDGTRIDYVETLEESGFKFNNPNVQTTCGCGSSFSA